MAKLTKTVPCRFGETYSRLPLASSVDLRLRTLKLPCSKYSLGANVDPVLERHPRIRVMCHVERPASLFPHRELPHHVQSTSRLCSRCTQPLRPRSAASKNLRRSTGSKLAPVRGLGFSRGIRLVALLTKAPPPPPRLVPQVAAGSQAESDPGSRRPPCDRGRITPLAGHIKVSGPLGQSATTS